MAIINKSNGNDNLVLELDWNEVRSVFLALGEVTDKEQEDAAWLDLKEDYFPKKVPIPTEWNDPWARQGYPSYILYMKLREILIERGEFRIETF